jgi:hypothetical protein
MGRRAAAPRARAAMVATTLAAVCCVAAAVVGMAAAVTPAPAAAPSPKTTTTTTAKPQLPPPPPPPLRAPVLSLLPERLPYACEPNSDSGATGERCCPQDDGEGPFALCPRYAPRWSAGRERAAEGQPDEGGLGPGDAPTPALGELAPGANSTERVPGGYSADPWTGGEVVAEATFLPPCLRDGWRPASAAFGCSGEGMPSDDEFEQGAVGVHAVVREAAVMAAADAGSSSSASLSATASPSSTSSFAFATTADGGQPPGVSPSAAPIQPFPLETFAHAGHRGSRLAIPDVGNVLDVRSFGAKGDGKTDDTAAFRRAVAAAPVGGALMIPPGTYFLRSSIVFIKNVVLRGEGPGVTTILADPMGDWCRKDNFGKPIPGPCDAAVFQVDGADYLDDGSSLAATVVGRSPRGSRTLRLSESEAEVASALFAPGEWVHVAYDSPADGALLEEMGAPPASGGVFAPLAPGADPNLAHGSAKDSPLANVTISEATPAGGLGGSGVLNLRRAFRFTAQVADVDVASRTVTLSRPLPIAVDPSRYRVELHRFALTRIEMGFENMTVRFLPRRNLQGDDGGAGGKAEVESIVDEKESKGEEEEDKNAGLALPGVLAAAADALKATKKAVAASRRLLAEEQKEEGPRTAIALYNVAHSWVRDVDFAETSTAVLVERSSHVTLTRVRLLKGEEQEAKEEEDEKKAAAAASSSGGAGKNSTASPSSSVPLVVPGRFLHLRYSSDVLLHRFVTEVAPKEGDVQLEGVCIGNVVSRGRAADLAVVASEGSAVAATLVTDVDAGAGSRLLHGSALPADAASLEQLVVAAAAGATLSPSSSPSSNASSSSSNLMIPANSIPHGPAAGSWVWWGVKLPDDRAAALPKLLAAASGPGSADAPNAWLFSGVDGVAEQAKTAVAARAKARLLAKALGKGGEQAKAKQVLERAAEEWPFPAWVTADAIARTAVHPPNLWDGLLATVGSDAEAACGAPIGDALSAALDRLDAAEMFAMGDGDSGLLAAPLDPVAAAREPAFDPSVPRALRPGAGYGCLRPQKMVASSSSSSSSSKVVGGVFGSEDVEAHYDGGALAKSAGVTDPTLVYPGAYVPCSFADSQAYNTAREAREEARRKADEAAAEGAGSARLPIPRSKPLPGCPPQFPDCPLCPSSSSTTTTTSLPPLLLPGDSDYVYNASRLWGCAGEAWRWNTVMPWDWSAVGYKAGDEVIPGSSRPDGTFRPHVPVVADVKKDCGAKGDGETDDTDAFEACLARAQPVLGGDNPGGAVFIPAGRYVITRRLQVNDKALVIRGAGMDNTTLYMPFALAHVDLAAKLRVPIRNLTREQLLAAPVGGNDDGNSRYSHTDSFLLLKMWDPMRPPLTHIAKLTADVPRGSSVIMVDPADFEPEVVQRMASRPGGAAPMLTPGSWVRVVVNDTAEGDVVSALHLNSYAPAWTNRYRKAPYMVRFLARVLEADLETGRVRLSRRLPLDIPAAWKAQLHTYDPLPKGGAPQGVEDLTFEFPPLDEEDDPERGIKSGLRADHPPRLPYPGHLNEKGYNALELIMSANSWVRRVRVINAESSVACWGCTFTTFEDIEITASASPFSGRFGREGKWGLEVGPFGTAGTGGVFDGHRGLWLDRGSDNLVQRLSTTSRIVHDFSMQGAEAGTVVREVRAPDFNIDFHRGLPYANLYTRIDHGIGSRPFASGGAQQAGPHSGAWNTMWNNYASGLPPHLKSGMLLQRGWVQTGGAGGVNATTAVGGSAVRAYEALGGPGMVYAGIQTTDHRACDYQNHGGSVDAAYCDDRGRGWSLEVFYEPATEAAERATAAKLAEQFSGAGLKKKRLLMRVEEGGEEAEAEGEAEAAAAALAEAEAAAEKARRAEGWASHGALAPPDLFVAMYNRRKKGGWVSGAPPTMGAGMRLAAQAVPMREEDIERARLALAAGAAAGPGGGVGGETASASVSSSDKASSSDDDKAAKEKKKQEEEAKKKKKEQEQAAEAMALAAKKREEGEAKKRVAEAAAAAAEEKKKKKEAAAAKEDEEKKKKASTAAEEEKKKKEAAAAKEDEEKKKKASTAAEEQKKKKEAAAAKEDEEKKKKASTAAEEQKKQAAAAEKEKQQVAAEAKKARDAAAKASAESAAAKKAAEAKRLAEDAAATARRDLADAAKAKQQKGAASAPAPGGAKAAATV